MSYLEVLQGMRNKAELTAVKKMLAHRAATLLPVSEAITQRAIELMEAITLSHGLQMGDALIAATALDHGPAGAHRQRQTLWGGRGAQGRGVQPLTGLQRREALLARLETCPSRLWQLSANLRPGFFQAW